ncbi:hypothetical protein B0T26DRAFT_723724 [Lasiosphaeria miniovina]|uniref:Uncharacterized protein n=1 Tax=Lasiosphaeria miniovina TaxID=1954250 RepID=A0AA40DQX8_9PEZI|nr:uncharacterized protein B0T26DRAFT_723724 [Lasiosphaeria miniovina]KAK0709987.1 hypothetical protein B0T26DRAFT_723724 [Lasiosphaeria miniovina]
MGAETGCNRDIIISIHPQHVANIVSRAKNHEFRNYLLPADVTRFLIYETSPTSAIKYIATISRGKRPGDIRDPSGLRNDEFDGGLLEQRGVRYAYEIRRLDALATPITLADLKRNGWLGGPPQKYCFVNQPMRDALSAASLSLVFDRTAVAAAAVASPDGGAGGDLGAPPDAKQKPSQPPTSRRRRKGASTPGVAGFDVKLLGAPALTACQDPAVARRPTSSPAGGVTKRRKPPPPTAKPIASRAKQGLLQSWLEDSASQ